MKNVNYNDLLNVYDYEIRRNTRNKRKIFIFDKNKMENISNIYDVLVSDKYFPSKYNIFIIREPKYRIVMSLNISDKIINHYLARYVLIPKLDKYLDRRIVATRSGYGTDYGIKLVKKYIEINKKYNDFYVLKIDIKKYFYNIDHEVLKSLLRDKLDSDEYALISRIIDSTNNSYINSDIDSRVVEMIKKRPYDKDKLLDLPRYSYGKGLGLGAMTSQFLSIFYLSKLVHYIVHDLHLKHTIVYMDDLITMHHDKKYLYECLEKIEKILNNDYKLEVNKKKTKIVSIHEGFTFLGYRFLVRNKKNNYKNKKGYI